MIGQPKRYSGSCKMAALVKIGIIGVVINMIFIEHGSAFVHHQGEDLRTMFQQSEKTDYFGVIEKVSPVVYRIPKNSSEPSKEILQHTTHLFPKNVDFVLRRQQGILRMRLHRMRDVIGSHTRVEWTSEGDVMESKVLSTRCVYHGKVDGMENSLATIDLCNDMKGVIRTDDEDIYLQPAFQYTDRHSDTNKYKEKDTGRSNETHIIRVHPRKATQPMRFSKGASIDLTNDTSHTDNAASHRADGAKEWKSRAKRQAPRRGPRYMQVLLVTDGSLVRFHGRDLLEQYLLTQMSIVDNIYHHPTLGFEINLIVVKISIIDDHVVRRVVARGDGKTSLDRFCLWANEEKPKNKNKDEDFDVAVYITREEIGPAGYAPVTGMCNPLRSCALVKDDGTSSAFVIAHEIGHIFGMIHDGHGNDCSSDPSDGKIMASMVQSNYHMYYWSPCNTDAMEKYLVDVHCLDDKPKDPSWPVYSQPFGQSWSLDEQCRQEFGSGFGLCRVFDHLDPCYHLWCSHSNNQTLCKTKRGPPLPGTSCGRGKWCMSGSCMEKQTVSVDGGWSTWQKWDSCSRTCGVGMQFRVRSCTHPRPKHGGSDCKGDREEFRTCNTQPCPKLSDFREEQCTEFNAKRFDEGRRHHWLPIDNKNASDMCKMTCVSMETGTILVSESNAIDGTFCSYDQPHHVCVKGTCHPVGCDGVLNSRQRDDQCGQCGGNGSTCKRVTGVITEPLSKKEYHRILVVPAKARNIAIRELHSTPHLAHFIAVRDPATERWYLNGNTQQGPSKQFVAHGTSFTYSVKQREGESLTARGPLLAPVDIMIYSMSTKLPPALDYEYTIPPEVTQTTNKQITETRVASVLSRYVWSVSGVTNCSKPCGSGVQFELFTCVDTEKRQLSDGFCSLLSKPNETRKDCNTHPCGLYTYWWDAEDWSTVVTCSASCGIHGFQQRRVQCVTDDRGKTKAIEPAYCNQRHMPIYVQPCNRFPCTVPPEELPSSPRVSSTTEGADVVDSIVEGDGDEEVGINFNGAQPRGGRAKENSHISATRPTEQTTAATLLEVLTSTAAAQVHEDTIVNGILRPPFERNKLERISVLGSFQKGRIEVDESTQASTFEGETPQSSTARKFSLEDEELFLFNRNLEETTTPHTGTSPLFEAEDTDDDDFSSSLESEVELGLLFDRTTHRPGSDFPRSTTFAFQVPPPFQPVDPHPVVRINRIERGRRIVANEDRQLARNYEGDKSVYGNEVLETYGSVVQTTSTSTSGTTTLKTASRTSTTANTITTTAPISIAVVPKPVTKPSSTTTVPIKTTLTSTNRATATSSPTAITTTAKAPNPNTASTTASAALAIGTLNSTPAVARSPSSTAPSVHSITKAANSTSPVVTGSGTSSVLRSRPLKAKTTVRKHPRKHYYVQPEATTQPARNQGVPKLKMIPVESRYRGFPSTQLPHIDCSSDRSALFCRAGANRDRCSKPTFYTLCCVSCRAYIFPAL